MLLLEQFPDGDAGRVQVFGTDIDLDALVTARSGSYGQQHVQRIARAARPLLRSQGRALRRPEVTARCDRVCAA